MRVTANDLTRAIERIDAAVRVVDDIGTDTTTLMRHGKTESDASTWWVGPQGDDVRSHLDAVHDAATTAGPAWQSAGSTLTSLRYTASTLHTELVGLEAADDVDDRSVEGVGDRWAAACRLASRRLDGALDAAARSQPESSTVRLGGLVLPTGLALAAIEAALGGEPPPVDGAPAVAAWFATLSVAERRTWLGDAPQVVGNTDGIPYDVRIAANRVVMQDVVDRLGPTDPLLGTMEQFLLPGTTTIDPNRQIVFFDPAGDGRVAELFGDLADADRVAVLVPGMGSTMANFTSGVGGDARSLFAASPGTAVIAWTGYDAPAGIETGRVHEVASDAQARAGGAALASFIDGLDIEHDSPTTVVGHSYGSLTVGQGLLQGVQVDRVVFIGSPGVGVDHVSEFPRGAAREFYAGEIDGDPVATLEQFGEAPTDPDFGATEFDAGSSDALDPIARHSRYYDDGPGIENLATIVEGGEPTGTGQRPSEHLIEFSEDVDAVVHGGIDFTQEHVDVPFVDGAVDAGIDGVQSTYDRVASARDTVFETVDNVGSSAVGKARQLVDDIDVTFRN